MNDVWLYMKCKFVLPKIERLVDLLTSLLGIG